MAKRDLVMVLMLWLVVGVVAARGEQLVRVGRGWVLRDLWRRMGRVVLADGEASMVVVADASGSMVAGLVVVAVRSLLSSAASAMTVSLCSLSMVMMVSSGKGVMFLARSS